MALKVKSSTQVMNTIDDEQEKRAAAKVTEEALNKALAAEKAAKQAAEDEKIKEAFWGAITNPDAPAGYKVTDYLDAQYATGQMNTSLKSWYDTKRQQRGENPTLNYVQKQAKKAAAEKGSELEAYRSSAEHTRAVRDHTVSGTTGNAAADAGLSFGNLLANRISTGIGTGDKKEAALRAEQDYLQNLADTVQEQKVMQKDLAVLQSWPSEDREDVETYLNHGDIVFGQPDSIGASALDRLNAKYGKDTVKQITESYSRYKNAQSAEATANLGKENASLIDGVLAIPMSVVGSVTGAASQLGAVVNDALGLSTGRYQTIDPNLPGTLPGIYAENVLSGEAENVGEWAKATVEINGGGEKAQQLAGTVASTVYSAGMSALENLTTIYFAGGAGSLALAATKSFNSEMRSASLNGASPEQALAIGLVSGGLEVLTEKVSLDNLLSKISSSSGSTSGIKNILVEAFKQGAFEVSEEELSFLGGVLAEAAILRDKSDYRQTIADLVASGMSYDDALQQVNSGLIKEAGQTAVQSFLSGAMMSGITSAADNLTPNNQFVQAAEQYDADKQATLSQTQSVAERVKDLLDMTSPTEQTAAANGQKTAQSPGQLTANDLIDIIDESAAKRSGAPADPVAAALEGLAKTGKVTNKQAEDIMDNTRAVQRLVQEAELKELSGTASENRTAVKAAVLRLSQQQTAVDTAENTDYDNINNFRGGNNHAAGQQQVDHRGVRWSSQINSQGEIAGSTENGSRDASSRAQSGNPGTGDRRILYAADSEGRRINEQTSDLLRGTSVLDSSGAPIAVYHATDNMEFNTFAKGDTGFHFGTKEQAQKRSADKNFSQGRIFRVYLNIKNPIRARADIMGWTPRGTALALWADGILSDTEYNEVISLWQRGDGYDSASAIRLREILESKGYDGIVYPNGFEGNGDSYIAFWDDQIIRSEITELMNNGKADTQEVMKNSKDMESNSGRDRQGTAGTNDEGRRGDAEGEGHDLGRVLYTKGVHGGSTAVDGVQVQQPGGFSQEVNPETPNTAKQVSADESVGAAPAGFDPITHLQYEYGTIPEGEKAVRDDSLPVSTDGKNRVSWTARTAKGAEVTPDDFADLIDTEVVKGGLTYIPITNSETTRKAIDYIKKNGWKEAKSAWSAAVHAGKTGADLIAQGALLLNNAANAGDKKTWLEILHDYQFMGTNTAQGLQALRILKKLEPSDKLHMIKRSIDQMVEDMHLDTEISLDEDILQAYENAETVEEENWYLSEIQQSVADQIPATFIEKWTALRYVNMLGNLRTQVRNIAGNLGMKAISSVKNTVAAAVEELAYKASGGKFEKTKSLTVSREQLRAAKADFAGMQSAVLGDGKYADSNAESTEFAQGVRDRRQIFGFKPLEGYRKATNWAMERGDLIFSKDAYARALAGNLKARGITETDYSKIDVNILDEARLYAVKEAQEQTFRDTNWLSGWVSKWARRKDTPSVGKALAEGIMPFRKTPANVLLRAEEYSPLGVVNSVVTSIQKAAGSTGLVNKKGVIGNFARLGQQITGAQVINSWAKTLTGTGIFGLGMLLQSLGMLTAGPDEDENEENFESLNGWQNYALVLPDGTNLTIDFLTPAAMPLLMGAELKRLMDDGGIQLKDLESSLASIAEPMIQMSMLQGISDTLDNVRYAQSSLGQLLVNAGLSYLTQGLTNTGLGQLERAFESSRMSTYTDKDSALPTWLQRTIGKASAKIPGWDYNQIPYINAWGEEEENPDTGINVIYNMLSPSYIEKGVTDEVSQELKRLNGVQDLNVYPSTPDKTVTYNGGAYNLSAEEYVALAKTQGQMQRRIVEDIVASSDYTVLSDEDKAKAIRYAYDYARDAARAEVLPDYPGFSSKWMEQINGNTAGAIIRKVVMGNAYDKYASLSIEKASWVDEFLSSLSSLQQKVEAVTSADSRLSEKEQREVLKDVLDNSAWEKYQQILELGYSNDDYADSYRIYTEEKETGGKGTKARTIAEFQEKFDISYEAAKALYEIYNPN